MERCARPTGRFRGVGWAACALLCTSLPIGLLAAACGGSTSPSAATLDGTWNGQVTYSSATPSDHCYARFLAGLGTGHLYLMALDLRQEGSRLTGTLRGTQIVTSCQLNGQVTSLEVAWRQTGCAQACTTLQEGSCPAFRLCVVDHSFTGRLTSSGLSGAHSVAWETTDPSTGRSLGRLEIAGTLAASR